MYFTLKDIKNISDFKSELSNKGIDLDDIDISSTEDIIVNINKINKTIKLSKIILFIIISISIIVLLVTNIISVYKRKRELYNLYLYGMKISTIIKKLIIESFIYSLLSIIISFIIVLIFKDYFPIDIYKLKIDSVLIAYLLIISLIVITISNISYLIIYKLLPLKEINYESK